MGPAGDEACGRCRGSGRTTSRAGAIVHPAVVLEDREIFDLLFAQVDLRSGQPVCRREFVAKVAKLVGNVGDLSAIGILEVFRQLSPWPQLAVCGRRIATSAGLEQVVRMRGLRQLLDGEGSPRQHSINAKPSGIGFGQLHGAGVFAGDAVGPIVRVSSGTLPIDLIAEFGECCELFAGENFPGLGHRFDAPPDSRGFR